MSNLPSDQAFLTECYALFFGRPPDATGLEHYLAALAAGRSRVSVALEFAKSAEFTSTLGLAPVASNRSSWQLPPVIRNHSELPIRETEQLALLQALAPLYSPSMLPEAPSPGFRYYLDNPWFSYFDGLVLHLLLRHFQVQRVIEVGSGFSSALIVDTNERYLDGSLDLTCIEPDPSRLTSLVEPTDCLRLISERVQDVPVEVFEALGPGDVLFIDSSHTFEPGSDVAHLLFQVLPSLLPGVLVHFHDIFASFGYPREWDDRGWNEGPVLRAYLAGHSSFEIVLFNDFLAETYGEILKRHMPLALSQPQGSPFRNSGVSLWLRKTTSRAVV